jgi:nitric oxide reductase subunit C
MKFKPTFVYVILCAMFLTYSFTIYLAPINRNDYTRFNKINASDGRLVWQKYNCQSCHQLYGLGGYLGPDLTNIISQPNKGENLVRAMLKVGTKQMPAFDLSRNETNLLIEFLKSADVSGDADARSFKINKAGMIDETENK